MWVFLRSNSSGLSSCCGCSNSSKLCFFSMISSCPVSSLSMNSLPANITRLLGFMDSLLRMPSASSTAFTSVFTTFRKDNSYSQRTSLKSCTADCQAARAFRLVSCYCRQCAYSCLVGLQSSSSYDSQSWKYFRIMDYLQKGGREWGKYEWRGGMGGVSLSLVAVGDGLITLQAVGDEAFEVLGVLDALDESLSEEVLEVPESLGVADESQPVLLEEVAEASEVVLEAVVIEIPPHMQLPEVSDITQHLHELQVLDELAVQLVGLLSVVGRHLRLLALHRLTLLLEFVRLPLRHYGYYYFQMLEGKGSTAQWGGAGGQWGSGQWGREGGQLRQLRELDLEQIEKPKTLVMLHYCGKRISVPLFQEVLNLAQLLYHHIATLEKTILSNEPAWEKQSNAQIVCFEIKKDAAAMGAPERQSDGDLRSDVLLSLLRIGGKAEDSPEELVFRVDVTKVYKYLEIQPFFRYFEQQPRSLSQPQQAFPYFQVHRLLAQTRLSTTYLARRASNGHFYTLKVYASGARIGLEELRTVEQMQRIDQARRDQDLRCGLLVRSHLTALIPHPEAEEGDSDDETSCKYIAIASPFFPRGTLEDLLKDARYNRLRRVSEMECLNFLKELMWGVHLLHEKYNLIHRAIVPSHLLIDQNGQLRLTHYFSCLPCYGPDAHASYLHKGPRRPTPDPEEAFEEGEFEIGEYTAPEVIRGQPYNYLVDFYAIGIIVRKLYEVSQAHERVPVSQNNENLMMTMINRLTSTDLQDRQAIVAEIIEDIERENLEAADPPILPLSSLLLQDIKVGRPIEPTHSKKYIENEESGNGVDLQVIINYFRKPKAKAAMLRPSKKPAPKRSSKEKQSVKNSREKSEKGKEKSEKCFSKASDSSLDPHRRLSKKKTGSLSKDSLASHSRERQGVRPMHPKKEESPAKKPSKSKSHEKRKKEEGNVSGKLYTHQEEESRHKPAGPVLPKSPKSLLNNTKSHLQNKYK